MPKKLDKCVREVRKKIRKYLLPLLSRPLRILRKDLDFLYNKEFATNPLYSKIWAGDFCNLILEMFNPKSVIDFGCGTGDILAPFEKKGITVLGMDGSKTNMKYSKIKRSNFILFDLRKKYESKRKCDLCLCLEAAEHIGENYSDRLVETLTQSSPTVIFTAAPPGQEGRDHVNLKPCAWWIEKFQKYNFKYDGKITDSLKKKMENISDVQRYYIDNLMVFKRDDY